MRTSSKQWEYFIIINLRKL